ncbi:MAG: 6-phosphogluconolactonase [Melioribacteraceae bacterium]
MRKDKIIVFNEINDAALKAVEFINQKLERLPSNNFFTIALSGGSTPKNLFDSISKNYSDKIDWRKIKLFWGDERCVPPEHEDSNYRMTYENLIKHIQIPSENVFRIYGESDPLEEAKRYSEILQRELKIKDGVPSFDLIILGLGEDGHTASIFPNQLNLFYSEDFCVTAVHPVTKQKRISITGKIINNADTIVFLVTGEKKAQKIYEILNEKEAAKNYPAYFVNPVSKNLVWLIDKDAAQLIDPAFIK